MASLWDVVATFSRDASTGQLTFVQVLKDGQGGVDGLDLVRSVTVSPDGQHVYAASLADDGEQIFVSRSLTAGLNGLSINLSGQAANTLGIHARFRFSSTGGLSFDGPAADGEVEDYHLAVTWFGPARALNTNAEVDSGQDWTPQITADSAGNWIAVWNSGDSLGGTLGFDSDIVFSRSTDAGRNWTAPAAVSINATTDVAWDFKPQVTTALAGIAEFDFGDAPDPAYPTLLANFGARHLLGSAL